MFPEAHCNDTLQWALLAAELLRKTSHVFCSLAFFFAWPFVCVFLIHWKICRGSSAIKNKTENPTGRASKARDHCNLSKMAKCQEIIKTSTIPLLEINTNNPRVLVFNRVQFYTLTCRINSGKPWALVWRTCFYRWRFHLSTVLSCTTMKSQELVPKNTF